MAREAINKPLLAAVESLLEQFMPKITDRLDAVQAQITELRRDVALKLAELRREMSERFDQVNDRFERSQELVNELGLRIHSVGAKLDAFTEIIKIESGKRDDMLERIVRLEMTAEPKSGTRKKRAG